MKIIRQTLVVLSLAFAGAWFVTANKPAIASDLPVIHIPAGSLAADQTWSAGNVYYVDGLVTIGSGRTLTVQPGAIVKFAYGAGLSVQQGGVLSSVGNTNAPIVFTSYRDDSVGGDSNGDGPSAGAYGDTGNRLLDIQDGTIDLKFSTLRYGNEAVVSTGATDAASIIVTDNTFECGVLIMDNTVGATVLQRNTFDVPPNGTGALYVVRSAPEGISMAGADRNVFMGDGQSRAVLLDGVYVAPQTAWTVDGTGNAVLVMPGNGLRIDGAMHIGQGAVLKYRTRSIEVSTGGSLTVAGAANQRAIFTTYRDDTVGGDTNGDGESAGSYWDTDAGAIVASPGSVIDVVFADFRLLRYNVSGNCYDGGELTITDSRITGRVDASFCDHGSLTVQRNQFEIPDGTSEAVSVSGGSPSGIVLTGTNKNVFVTPGRGATVILYGVEIAAGTAWSLSSENGAVVLFDGVAHVYGELSVEAGTILKVGSGSIVSHEGSTVLIEGEANSHVRVTSASDDALGGDNNGDGPTLPTTVGVYVFENQGGALTIRHTTFREYVPSAVHAACTTGNVPGMTIVTDSRIEATVTVWGCPTGTITFARNTFLASANSYQHALIVRESALSGLILSGDNKNTFEGADQAKVVAVSDSFVPSGASWHVAGDSGSVLFFDGTNTIQGQMFINAGAIVKYQDSFTTRLQVQSGGELIVQGTSSEPAVFTSARDDVLGGDSNYDGNMTQPERNVFAYAIQAEANSTVDINHAQFRYAAIAVDVHGGTVNGMNMQFSNVGTGFNVDGGALAAEQTTIDGANTGIFVTGTDSLVTYRGAIKNITDKGIRSCYWLEGCVVSATFTDWDGPLGPFPTSGPLVCGQMIASPWIYDGGVVPVYNVYNMNNCSDIADSPKYRLEVKATAFENLISQEEIDCSEGIQEACDQWALRKQCITDGVADLALQYYGLPMPTGSDPVTEPMDYVQDAVVLLGQHVVKLDPTASLSTIQHWAQEFKRGGNLLFGIHDAYEACTQLN